MVLEDTARQLIEACQRGEPDAFRALFEKYKDLVYSVALRYSGDPAAAQDIAQDIFLKLFSTIGSYRGDANFEAWLYRMVVNRCFDQKRKTRRLAPLLDAVMDVMHAPDVNALDEVLRAEMSTHVREVVETLSPDQRMVIILRYTQGLSYDAIAEIVGCSAGTIASRLNRAHKVLERRLARSVGVRKDGTRKPQEGRRSTNG